MQFEIGQSGNPSGRPRGARNRRTLLAEQLLDGRAETILNKIFMLVDEGDPAAMRLCMDRISPRLKDRPVAFELPALERPADAAAAMAKIAQGLSDGDLTPAEAADFGKFVASFSLTLAVTELQDRVKRLEQTTERECASKAPRRGR
jgi:hypothetical protein